VQAVHLRISQNWVFFFFRYDVLVDDVTRLVITALRRPHDIHHINIVSCSPRLVENAILHHYEIRRSSYFRLRRAPRSAHNIVYVVIISMCYRTPRYYCIKSRRSTRGTTTPRVQSDAQDTPYNIIYNALQYILCVSRLRVRTLYNT